MYRCLIHSLIYVHPELNAIDLYLLSPCSIRLDMGLEKDDPCCQGGWRKWYCGKNTIEVNSRETLRKFIASLLQHTRLKGLKNTQSKKYDFIIKKLCSLKYMIAYSVISMIFFVFKNADQTCCLYWICQT